MGGGERPTPLPEMKTFRGGSLKTTRNKLNALFSPPARVQGAVSTAPEVCLSLGLVRMLQGLCRSGPRGTCTTVLGKQELGDPTGIQECARPWASGRGGDESSE